MKQVSHQSSPEFASVLIFTCAFEFQSESITKMFQFSGCFCTFGLGFVKLLMLNYTYYIMRFKIYSRVFPISKYEIFLLLIVSG